MKRVLGIDQSMSSTGIVIFEDKSLIHHEILRTSKNDKNPLDLFIRVNEISGGIKNICIEYSVDSVVIEGLGFGAVGNATRNLAGLQFCIVTTLVGHLNIEPIIIAPTSLKKQATGNGKASKDDMVEAVKGVDQAFYDVLVSTPKTKGRYDLADAFFLGYIFGDWECTTTKQ